MKEIQRNGSCGCESNLLYEASEPQGQRRKKQKKHEFGKSIGYRDGTRKNRKREAVISVINMCRVWSSVLK